MSGDGQAGDGGGEDSILIAEFALGLLDAEEHAQVARRLAAEPALRAELGSWQRRFGAFDEEFEPATPPAAVYDRIAARLFPDRSPQRLGWWSSLALWRGLAAGALAVAVIAVGIDLLPRAPLTGQELVAALEAQGSNVKFVAFYDDKTGMLRLAALSGSAVPDKDYELWAIEGKNAPVSMGVVPVDAKSKVVMSDTMKSSFGAGTVLAVTLEQKGGSPTGAPQGPIVASGTATAI